MQKNKKLKRSFRSDSLEFDENAFLLVEISFFELVASAFIAAEQALLDEFDQAESNLTVCFYQTD